VEAVEVTVPLVKPLWLVVLVAVLQPTWLVQPGQQIKDTRVVMLLLVLVEVPVVAVSVLRVATLREALEVTVVLA